MYLWSLERLDGAGYRQYEISNVARPGRESRHNLKYWQDGEWLGFGCGAHSTRPACAGRTSPRTEDYIARVGRRAAGRRRAASSSPSDERLEEALFTGLRLTDGLDIEAVGRALRRRRLGALRAGARSRSSTRGCCVREGPRLRLTREGMLVANEIMAVFV